MSSPQIWAPPGSSCDRMMPVQGQGPRLHICVGHGTGLKVSANNSEGASHSLPSLRIHVTQEKLQQLKEEGERGQAPWGRGWRVSSQAGYCHPGRKEGGCQCSGRSPGEQVGLA